jgi:hypothetical protein
VSDAAVKSLIRCRAATSPERRSATSAAGQGRDVITPMIEAGDWHRAHGIPGHRND